MDIRISEAEAELDDARDLAKAFAALAVGGVICLGVIFFFLG